MMNTYPQVHRITEGPKRHLLPRGKVYKFKDLPKEAQLAIAHYMGVDGEAWSFEELGVFEGLVDPHEFSAQDEREEFDAAFKHNAEVIVANLKSVLPEIVEAHGDYEIGLVTVPTAELIELWGEIDSDATEDFDGNFDAYHAWYQSTRHDDGRGGGENPTWPVILSGFHDELLEDGWHRFHQYIANGAEEITCLWYPH
jgi:hypothetical protein